jgi:hypothetical protein
VLLPFENKRELFPATNTAAQVKVSSALLGVLLSRAIADRAAPVPLADCVVNPVATDDVKDGAIRIVVGKVIIASALVVAIH